MPLYEYQCENCGEQFEVMQKFSDQPLSVHDRCGGKVHRLLSAPALQFKGSGWYITDYAKGASGGSAPKSAESNGKSDSSSSGSAESSSSKSAPAASEKKA